MIQGRVRSRRGCERPRNSSPPQGSGSLRLAGCVVIIHVMATISEALAIAIQHHQAGRLQAAEQIYRQILAVEPNHADAWHLSGRDQRDRLAITNVAVEYIDRALDD